MMFISGFGPLAVAAILASVCSASPAPVAVKVAPPQRDLAFREALDLAHTPHVEKRATEQFSMEKTWGKNETLFNG
jgi:hypothetical protein